MTPKSRPRRRRGLSGTDVRLIESVARRGWRPGQPLRQTARSLARWLRRTHQGGVGL